MKKIKNNGCDYCKGEKPLLTIGPELAGFTNRIFCFVIGDHMRIFDEEYPGFTESVKIKYCPKCGRKIKHKNAAPVQQ